MKKGSVRCWRSFTNVGWRYNLEVFYPEFDFGYGSNLYQCQICGEMYATSCEDPALSDVPAGDIPRKLIGEEKCVSCSSALTKTLAVYPATFLASTGERGHFIPAFDPADESALIDAWFLDR
jgi:hypothetical protein